MDAFRLGIPLIVLLPCVFAEKFKTVHRNWFSIIDPFVPLDKIFNCGTKWKGIPLLRAHLSSFLN
ncbi:uncharacterized protein METZ01_LOCUS77141 [marine metagenome]|uniref:Uncharacterized protein n=1 Tax=marine metagenome TaxID=408172 RepID=A0A381UAA0_9ZZZZ